MLSWREIDEMKRYGIDVGSHTLSHPDLTRLTPARAEHEIRRSREIIEDRLGARAECFAYPYGRYDEAARDIVRRHYSCACSTRLGLADHDSDPHALERVEAYYLRAGRSYEWMLSRRFPLYLRARAMPRWVRQLLAPGGA
jgi:peptidoglycan/xylan/chitin deacetylase (PgdA/CDA1 family)